MYSVISIVLLVPSVMDATVIVGPKAMLAPEG